LQGAQSEGFEVVLANSNPATIMTDPESADRTYIEAAHREYLEEIIRVERELSPSAGFAILPTVGGQTRSLPSNSPTAACSKSTTCIYRRTDQRHQESRRPSCFQRRHAAHRP